MKHAIKNLLFVVSWTGYIALLLFVLLAAVFLEICTMCDPAWTPFVDIRPGKEHR